MSDIDEEILVIDEENADEKNATNSRKRFPFSKEEDDHLLRLIKLFGKKNWKIIAFYMKGRNIRQCRERFQLYLDDKIRNSKKWSKEEDEILLSKFKEIGPRWKLMESFFTKRNMYSIKNRYKALVLKKNKSSCPKNKSKKKLIENQIYHPVDNISNINQQDTINGALRNDYLITDLEFDLNNYQFEEFYTNFENSDYFDEI
ncbi:hypothetical protein M9Y10_027203 [Tritrichomonas musculus]|uniref:Myb-like DNA-binding domain containing protein n=1 Tax=Tritrichomonas musculus TaxID=1915356 RepID=A0ABR2H6X8_9EUKA